MTAKVRIHWLLTLLALIMPTTFANCRAAERRDETVRPKPAPEVVFRHFL